MPDIHSSETSGKRVVTRRNALKAVGGAGLAMTAGCLDELQTDGEWPSRQIEIVVPWASGGGADTTSRAVADAAEEFTDVSWNVANQEGGSGSVGMNEVANAEPDGHTLGVAAPEITLFDHLGQDDLNPDDITPIMQYADMPAALVVHEDDNYSTVGEFVDYAEDNPGDLDMSHSGTGSSWHLAGAGFADEAGIEVDYVSYDGADPAITAVVNGEVDCTVVGAAEVHSHVVDGDLNGLGVMYDEELDALPDTPTMMAEGIDIEIGSWLGHFAPADLADDVRDDIADVYESVYDSDEFSSFLEDNHFTQARRGPEEFQEFLDEQYDYYEELVDDLGIEG
ncbi:tripartite tricarboxylate transporter substrate binding protein [Halostagnicola sp. A-GB9-2]|uniref:Bug family tripartite tricarboxylate transporter substrate binding protein n=1 Tax=Halostagnicola sp. A-GB9-2 TaxID=3048066 RepID=UPI0024BFE8BB|nr:tripartite tricarboxylate transporter substrate binding protein [Halostagnicola sp. A-GB9-2]MDJ1433681.1 tripartite tricarboxylate transporter substrate binding protein [Halostagnicola sp. A-GB9-2]